MTHDDTIANFDATAVRQRMAIIAAALSCRRLRFGTEEQLQSDVAVALAGANFACVREFQLGAAGRVDFYLPDFRIAIECKVGGGPSGVAGQLIRYADCSDVAGVILVTSRKAHVTFFTEKGELSAKPFKAVWIGASGL